MVSALMMTGKTKSMCWNLTSPVGPGKPNLAGDVEFVRFGYFLMRDNPIARPFLTDREKRALAAVRPQGLFGPDLAECIAAHEQSRGGTQDGFVSVMRDVQVNKGAYDHKHKWIVLVLNNNMIDMTVVFPRIDLHGASGPQISKAVAGICNFKH